MSNRTDRLAHPDLDSRDRLNYVQGMLLDAESFGDEQLYHRGRLARALAYLFGTGTVAGLAVAYRNDAGQDEIEVAPGIHATWPRAGHILGSAVITVRFAETGRTITFTGDLGRNRHPLLRPPEPLSPTDVVVSESTYGNRRHEPEAEVLDRLRDAVIRTVARGSGCGRRSRRQSPPIATTRSGSARGRSWSTGAPGR